MNQRQELVTLTDVDFVDADGAQGPQLAMLQPPANNVFNRMTDLI